MERDKDKKLRALHFATSESVLHVAFFDSFRKDLRSGSIDLSDYICCFFKNLLPLLTCSICVFLFDSTCIFSINQKRVLHSSASVEYNLTGSFNDFTLEGLSAVSIHVFSPLGAEAGTITAYAVQSLEFIGKKEQKVVSRNLLDSEPVKKLRSLKELDKKVTEKTELFLRVDPFEDTTETLKPEEKEDFISKVKTECWKSIILNRTLSNNY